jgi:hypothetical protein
MASVTGGGAGAGVADAVGVDVGGVDVAPLGVVLDREKPQM